MKCINSLLALSIIIIINSCSTMKSNLKTQFTNISSIIVYFLSSFNDIKTNIKIIYLKNYNFINYFFY